MKKRGKSYAYSTKLTFALSLLLCNTPQPAFSQGEFQQLSGAYLGQTHPGMQPQMFVPEALRSNADWFWHGALAFSPDGHEFYLDIYVPATNQGIRTRFMEMNDNVWSSPRSTAFAGSVTAASPTFTNDGAKVFFISDRPNGRAYSVWSAVRSEVGWAAATAVNIPSRPSLGNGWRVSVTNDETLYMQMVDNNLNTDFDIYRVERSNDVYSAPERLNGNINSASMDLGAFIDPDENYIIFGSSRPGGYGSTDLYISFKDPDGFWMPAINMGATVNSSATEGGPFVSADGSYFFFLSDHEPQYGRNPYWVDARVITDLNPVSVDEHPAQGIAPEQFQLHQNYPNPFNPTTRISYDLPRETRVVLKIYDLLGHEVRTLVNEDQASGSKSVAWDSLDNSGRRVSSGVYFYRLHTAGSKTPKQSKKMLLLR